MSVLLLDRKPTFEAAGVLTIESLAPLSMVVQMPGKYYHSQREPSHEMLYGMLENALGWHFGDKDRTDVLNGLVTRLGLSRKPTASGVGFKSLLQYHVRFGVSVKEEPGSMLHYDDYWSQHLRTAGQEFIGGSREYDSRAIPVMDANARSDDDPMKVRFSDRREFEVPLRDTEGKPVKVQGKTVKRSVMVRKDPGAPTHFGTDDVLHFSVMRPYFPRYYITPTPREYVAPRTAYRYRVETSLALATVIAKAIEDPAAPLYLGSSDGWVDVTWRTIQESPK